MATPSIHKQNSIIKKINESRGGGAIVDAANKYNEKEKSRTNHSNYFLSKSYNFLIEYGGGPDQNMTFCQTNSLLLAYLCRKCV